jgi:hypothetical protein
MDRFCTKKKIHTSDCSGNFFYNLTKIHILLNKKLYFMFIFFCYKITIAPCKIYFNIFFKYLLFCKLYIPLKKINIISKYLSIEHVQYLDQVNFIGHTRGYKSYFFFTIYKYKNKFFIKSTKNYILNFNLFSKMPFIYNKYCFNIKK